MIILLMFSDYMRLFECQTDSSIFEFVIVLINTLQIVMKII